MSRDKFVAASDRGCLLCMKSLFTAIFVSARSVSVRACVSSSIGLLPGIFTKIGYQAKQSEIRIDLDSCIQTRKHL